MRTTRFWDVSAMYGLRSHQRSKVRGQQKARDSGSPRRKGSGNDRRAGEGLGVPARRAGVREQRRVGGRGKGRGQAAALPSPATPGIPETPAEQARANAGRGARRGPRRGGGVGPGVGLDAPHLIAGSGRLRFSELRRGLAHFLVLRAPSWGRTSGDAGAGPRWAGPWRAWRGSWLPSLMRGWHAPEALNLNSDPATCC